MQGLTCRDGRACSFPRRRAIHKCLIGLTFTVRGRLFVVDVDAFVPIVTWEWRLTLCVLALWVWEASLVVITYEQLRVLRLSRHRWCRKEAKSVSEHVSSWAFSLKSLLWPSFHLFNLFLHFQPDRQVEQVLHLLRSKLLALLLQLLVFNYELLHLSDPILPLCAVLAQQFDVLILLLCLLIYLLNLLLKEFTLLALLVKLLDACDVICIPYGLSWRDCALSVPLVELN